MKSSEKNLLKAQLKTKVLVFASSHGTEHRNFPTPFKSHFLKKNQWRFAVPKIQAKGGQRINESLVKEITGQMAAQGPDQPFVVVLILATNNVRKDSSEQNLLEVVRWFEDIAKTAETLSKCRVLISQLIPSVLPPESKDKFRELERRLVHLLKKYPNTTLAKTTKALCEKGKIQKRLWQDGVHLTKTGAKIYAKALFKQLESLPHFPLD